VVICSSYTLFLENKKLFISHENVLVDEGSVNFKLADNICKKEYCRQSKKGDKVHPQLLPVGDLCFLLGFANSVFKYEPGAAFRRL
jgi:hypothetical protein